MKSKENNGTMFDTLMINSFGWGGEPSRYLRVNAEKTKWYRFDGNYRRIDYFNSLTNIALNQHTSNTEHRLGDFDLTLLPQNKRIKFNVGYSLDRNSGPTVTTYDYARDEFPVLAPTRVTGDDYRVGVDASVGPFDLSFQQGWRYFKEDTTYTIDEPQIGNNPINTSVLNTFNRELPTRGRIPYSRASLHTLLAKKVDITGRIIYQSARTDYNLFETITGKDASNNNIKLDEFTISGQRVQAQHNRRHWRDGLCYRQAQNIRHRQLEYFSDQRRPGVVGNVAAHANDGRRRDCAAAAVRQHARLSARPSTAGPRTRLSLITSFIPGFQLTLATVTRTAT